MPTRRAVLRRAGAAATLGAGCVGGRDGPRTVRMVEGFAFAPDAVTVDPGTTVVWPNESDVGHSVTADAERIPPGADYFASGGVGSEREARTRAGGDLVAPGERYEHTFEVRGDYAYVCVPHESTGMTGVVRVR